MYPEECIDTRSAIAGRDRSHETGRLLKLLHTWYARSRQRRQLLQLDERMYRDIGVAADEAQREARKPFWRA
jgi:uncharacterized protein YjiS (DUF1127 family)